MKKDTYQIQSALSARMGLMGLFTKQNVDLLEIRRVCIIFKKGHMPEGKGTCIRKQMGHLWHIERRGKLDKLERKRGIYHKQIGECIRFQFGHLPKWKKRIYWRWKGALSRRGIALLELKMSSQKGNFHISIGTFIKSNTGALLRREKECSEKRRGSLIWCKRGVGQL